MIVVFSLTFTKAPTFHFLRAFFNELLILRERRYPLKRAFSKVPTTESGSGSKLRLSLLYAFQISFLYPTSAHMLGSLGSPTIDHLFFRFFHVFLQHILYVYLPLKSLAKLLEKQALLPRLRNTQLLTST